MEENKVNVTMPTALVLHSGGLDSTVCLLLAKEQGLSVISTGIDYGQHQAIEMDYAAKQCERLAIPRKVLSIHWDKPDLTIPLGRSIEEMRSSVSPAFLPGRNAIFLALAAAEAVTMSASQIWIGVNSVDYSGYPDCRPEFVDAFQVMLEKAIPEAPRIVAPLLTLTKPQIAAEGLRLGLQPGETWSCYQPVAAPGGQRPCGSCDACILHEAAWRAIGVIA